jgi:alkylated DNA repair dioxygenase AlkB
MGAQNRRVAQFGFQYDYVNDRVDTKSPTPPIPQRLKELLHIEPHFSQCIVNEYGPNVLIPWHMDDLEFGPIISVYTFGENRPLLLKKKAEGNEQQQQYVSHPDHCSKYILQGSARYCSEHMVPVGKGARVSFTFRTHTDDPSS